ncbi:MAG: hypothetical protein H6873_05580 [Hyphomicrobiaceae bacterium]|nr:hypothetical protein [Hyphomicrobiaceae bacterium]
MSIPFNSYGLQLSFQTNVDELARSLGELDAWALPYITASALTDVAKMGAEAERRAMPFHIDRPKAWTTGGVRLENADKANLVSKVYLDGFAHKGTAAGRYLEPIIVGAIRRPKRYELHLRAHGILGPGEFTVPGSGARLDAYGNISPGTLERALSQLGAAENSAGYMANETVRSRKRNRRRVTARYFVADGSTGLPRGIWERQGRSIRPFLIFVGRAPSYRRSYPFGDAARESALRNFDGLWVKRFNAFVVSNRILQGRGTSGYLPVAA